MKKIFGMFMLVMAVAAMTGDQVDAHGFGGFHGGGGGFGGAGFHPGGAGLGGGLGGARPGGLGGGPGGLGGGLGGLGGGLAGDRLGGLGFGGGVHPGGFGGGAGRVGGLNAGGAGGLSGFRAGGAQGFRAQGPLGGSVGGVRAGGAEGLGGGGAGGIRAGGAEGFRAEGPRGGSVGGVRAGGAEGLRGGGGAGAVRAGGAAGFRAQGPGGGSVGGFRAGGVGGFATPSRSGLDSFLGLPSDAGAHHIGNSVSLAGGGSAGRGIAVGPRGNVAAGRYATGPRGNTFAHGAVAGPRGIHRVSAVNLHQNGVAVRSSFRSYGYYGRGWYASHPRAWYPNRWTYGTAWTAATWASLGNWFGYGNVNPVYYNYGTNVVYNEGNVYVNGQDAGSQQQYYEQASTLAATGSQAQDVGDQQDAGDQQWMPLGVFALTQEGADTSNQIFQLAVDKAGTLRGNFTDKSTNKTQQVTGAVDKQKQTAAWTIGENTTTVYQTGLYNLTKEQAPCLVHQGDDKTEQLLLVRLQKPKDSGDQ